MTKEQAFEKFKKIIAETIEKEAEIEKNARNQGIWLEGLDANRELLADLYKEQFNKAQELYAKIDE